MKKLTSLILFFVGAIAFGQNWEGVYSIDEKPFTFDIGTNLWKTDSGYLIKSYSKDEVADKQVVGFIETDVLGQVLSKSKFQHDYEYVSPWSHNSLFHLGHYYVSGYDQSGLNNGFGYFLMKFDLELNLLWEKTYSDQNFKSVHSIIVTQDQHIVIYGDSAPFQDDDEDVTLLKVDLDGNEIWRKTLGLTAYHHDSQLGNIVELPNGDFAIGYTCGEATLDWNTCVTVTDSQGNVKWVKEYFETNAEVSYWYPRILLHPLGYLQLSTTIDEPSDSAIGPGPYLHLVNLDYEGEILFDLEFNGSDYKKIVTSKVLDNGDTMLVGQVWIPSLGKDIGYISRVDADMNILWERYYSSGLNPYIDPSKYYCVDILEIENGFAVSGNGGYKVESSNGDEEQHNKAWLFTIDHDGCFQENLCQNMMDNIVSSNAHVLFETDVTIYPNPTTDLIKIQGYNRELNFRLSNTNGASLLYGQTSNSNIDLSGQKNGLYVLSLFDGKKLVHREKLIVLP